ncbi:MAG: arylsulfatase [Pseudomonadota bacterium]
MVAVLSGLALFASSGCHAEQGAVETKATAEAKPARPNIVLIVTDDQGNGDVGMNGNPIVQTPNIDRLAKESTYFSNFHVDPTCSPTRAALMTGKHSMRAGVWHTIMGRSLMPAKQRTIAEILQEQGYRTGIFGKWHLGDNYPFRPQDQGFDVSLIHGGGGVGQTPDYWGNVQFGDTYFRNGEPESFAGYATTVWFDEALKFIRESGDSPFFAYVALNAPHRPWRAPPDYVAPYEALGLPPEMARFYAMITHLDGQLGRLRNELDTLALSDDTVLIFMTDNGSALSRTDDYYGDEGYEAFLKRVEEEPEYEGWTFNSGLRGFKSEVYEGGHRVPLIVHSPSGEFGAPSDVDALTAHYDLLPTILDLVGIESPGDIDGISLVDIVAGNVDVEERTVVVTNQRLDIPSLDRPSVVMQGPWRYVVWRENGVEELFNLDADPAQKDNVLKAHPAVVSQLETALQEWWSAATAEGFARQRVIVGAAAENPVRLSAMDWMEAQSTSEVPWNPGFETPKTELPYARWLDREHEFGALPWYVSVAASDEYRVSVYLYDQPASRPVGKSWAILEVDGERSVQAISRWSSHAVFDVDLEQGNTKLKAWFADDEAGELNPVPAFFAYVKRAIP